MTDICEVNVRLSDDTIEEDAFKILEIIRPTWNKDDVTIKPIQGGLVNKMVKCSVDSDPSDKVIVKILGESTGSLLDRDTEFAIYKELHKANLMAPLYCKFDNGYAYKFEEGQLITASEFMEPKVYRTLHEQLHKLHTIDMEKLIGKKLLSLMNYSTPMMFEGFHAKEFDKLSEDDRFKNNLPSREELFEEMEQVLSLGQKIDSEFPQVTIHADTHQLNLLYNEEEERIVILDWELCGTGTEIQEIAGHLHRDLTAMMPKAGIIMSEQEEWTREWLHDYLKTHPNIDEVSDELVDKWYDATLKFGYVMYFCVTIWGLIESTKSAIEADYMGLALYAYDCARKLKAKYEKP